MRFQLLEDELDLPACRVSLGDGVGIEGIRLDVGQVEPILGALGESDRDQPQATSNGASEPGVDATLERHLDFDIEHVSLQPAGDLLEPPALEFDGPTHPGCGVLRSGSPRFGSLKPEEDFTYHTVQFPGSISGGGRRRPCSMLEADTGRGRQSAEERGRRVGGGLLASCRYGRKPHRRRKLNAGRARRQMETLRGACCAAAGRGGPLRPRARAIWRHSGRAAAVSARTSP